jgi:hypothetical protein
MVCIFVLPAETSKLREGVTAGCSWVIRLGALAFSLTSLSLSLRRPGLLI